MTLTNLEGTFLGYGFDTGLCGAFYSTFCTTVFERKLCLLLLGLNTSFFCGEGFLTVTDADLIERRGLGLALTLTTLSSRGGDASKVRTDF